MVVREKTLWRMLYETAARASEILALDVEQLDLDNRSAPIRSKGGDIEWVYWATGTAHLLPRLLRLPDGSPASTPGAILIVTFRSDAPQGPSPARTARIAAGMALYALGVFAICPGSKIRVR